MEKFDGRKAVGQHITVEEIKPLRIGLAPRSRDDDSERADIRSRSSRENRRERGSRERRKKATAEDLDKELEDYMNRGDVDSQESKQVTPKADVEGLDKELDDYMNRPFPAAN